MKAKLTMMVAMVASCAAIQLAAMPTEEETRKAEPVVKKMLVQERAALESGKKTRSEVADAAMKLADEADTDAAKLLLMKGAFVLYVRDGKLEKAVETMRALEVAIADMPPQSVTNMIEMALLGVAKKVDGARLYRLLDETKADIPSYNDLPSHVESKAIAASVEERSSVASILKGMIKLPGRNVWLSATEVTQGQWESVMGYNNSEHKGVNLPVECVSRDDCDVFLELLNKTKEVQSSQFEFRLPSYEEWACAAMAGGQGNCWVKPGVVGDVHDSMWYKENSSNQTHAVATKAANAFGFYDMLGNVWEWTVELDELRRGFRRGGAYHEDLNACRTSNWWATWMYHRYGSCGLRVAAQIRSGVSSGGVGKKGSARDDAAQRQADVDGYTWSYRVINGEAKIVTTNGHCVVSPRPTGDVSIPATLGGVKVTSIGDNAFRNCRGLTSVAIPESVASIGDCAFEGCCELKSVTIPSSVRNIGEWAFKYCYALKTVTIPPNLERIGCGAFCHCRGLMLVTIPEKVVSIGGAAFAYCSALRQIKVDAGNQTFASIDGVLYTKDQSVLLAFPNALTSVEIPKSVTNIGGWAFEGCSGLKSVTIPEGVKSIENNAFNQCGDLVSVTIPSSVTRIGEAAFGNCRGLKSVTLPEGVEVIDGSAFNRCSGLTSFALPSSVKSIGSFAFEGCGELTSLILPQGLTKIDFNAFRGLNKLTTMTIPASVTEIGGAVFSYCGGLTQINVEAENQKYTSVDGVLYTKDRTELVMCPNGLKSVTIPGSVTNIGLGAFIGCSKLTSVMLPSSLKSIGAWAFEGCNGLASVTIPANVTKIDRYAFVNCGGLASVTIRGERPDAPNNIFQGLKSIHVPANAKSWAGMKTWQGIPLVFDGEQTAEAAQRQAVAEREQQLETLRQIQEQLRRQREERDAAQRRVGQAVNAAAEQQQATVDGYTWSYRVNDGAATIVAEKGRRFSCAVSPMPTGDVKIPVTLNGVKVTSVGREAFRNCKGLTSVTIPEGVTHIDENAFCDCNVLKSVTIPLSVTNIAENAFGDGGLKFRRHSNGLKSFSVASDNPSYSSRNGMLCTKDGSVLIVGVNGDVVIPEGVTSIESFAFSGCSALTSVTIPNSVTNIGSWAFSDCRGLTSVAIPNSVTSIGWSTFSGCSGLTSVTIPNSVTNIGFRAFHGCRGLTSVAIPSSVRGIVAGAFSDCNGITSFSVDASNASYSSRDGMLCTKDGATLVAGVIRVNGNVTIPKGVVSIGASAFSGCSGLKSVTIPNGVTNIGNWAFSDCRGLTSVAISEGVTSIGADAFFDCRGLTSVTIPDSVTNIGVGAFHKCSALKSVTISSSVTGVDISAFFGTPFYDNQPDGMVVLGGVLYAYKGECPSSVMIPSSVTRIEKHAFAGCRGLKSVTIPSSVTNIAENAFGDRRLMLSRGKSNEFNGRKSFSVASDNPSYSSRNGMLCTKDGSILIVGVNGDVVIPECVTSIGNGAFKGCTSLNNVTIPNSVTTIGGAAFFGCSGLKSVTIPNGVTNIGSRAFHGCRELTSVAIPEGVTSIGADAFAGTPFYGNMPDGMVVLGGGVFCGYKGKCPSTVLIPSNVTCIAGEAFSEGFRFPRRPGLNSGAGIKMVVISSSVTNIGNRVFSYCGDLTNVTMCGERPEAQNDIFLGCVKLKSIHVPANAKSWAGMKAWQDVPLVFDGDDVIRQMEQDAQLAMESERQAEKEAERKR